MRRMIVPAAAIALVLAAGCAGLGTTHQLAPEGAWDVSQSQTSLKQTVEGAVEIDSGEYGAYSLSPRESTQVAVDFDAPEAVDVLILSDETYDEEYRDAAELQYKRDRAAINEASGTIAVTLRSGEYWIVVDNTAAYGAQPSGAVSVEIEMTAA